MGMEDAGGRGGHRRRRIEASPSARRGGLRHRLPLLPLRVDPRWHDGSGKRGVWRPASSESRRELEEGRGARDRAQRTPASARRQARSAPPPIASSREGAGHGSNPRRSIRRPVARWRASSKSGIRPLAAALAAFGRRTLREGGADRAAALPKTSVKEQRRCMVGERRGGRRGRWEIKKLVCGPRRWLLRWSTRYTG